MMQKLKVDWTSQFPQMQAQISQLSSMLMTHSFGGKTWSVINLAWLSEGSLPFTNLGLPLGTTKPNVEDFLPLIQRVERRLTCTSAFLSQWGKLEMVNSVFFSSMVFYISSMKMHKGVIKKLDKYRKHCLWRGADLNLKKKLLKLHVKWFVCWKRKEVWELLIDSPQYCSSTKIFG